ncbi:MAG TPA: pentapeptide repeat-containing protein [Ignavibacteriales bacterium]|nr:pentapeptide repeat-containing protein [Ignavibacteriales bacterium]
MQEKDHRLSFEEEFYQDDKFTLGQFSNGELREREFTGCSFENINFEKSKFKYVRFEDCTFNKCNMGLIKITGSRFIDCTFKDCKMLGINWQEAEGPVEIKINRCTLDYSVFYGLDLRRIEITESIAKEVNFENADLSRGNFNGTDFYLSKFKNTNLSSADLRDARNYDINPEFNKIKKARFSMPEVMTLLQCFDIEIS